MGYEIIPDPPNQSEDPLDEISAPKRPTESPNHVYEQLDESIRLFDVTRKHHYDHIQDIIEVILPSLIDESNRGPHVDAAQLLPNATVESTDRNSYESRTQIYEKVPDADIPQILSTAVHNLRDLTSGYDSAHLQAHVAQILSAASSIYERDQVYDRVPNMDIGLLLSNAAETAQIYEQVPNVDIAHLVDPYEIIQTYERVPNTDIDQILAPRANRNRSLLITDEDRGSDL